MRIKTVVLVAICCALVAFLKHDYAAEKTISEKDSLYIVVYSTGSGWQPDKPFSQQLHAASHNKFMQQLRRDSVARLGARYGDKGMLVIHSASLGDAKKLIASDSSVISKTFNAEVYTANFFYKGCVE